MIVQDSRRSPTSGDIVALLGNYDPHTKTAVFDKEKASFYLEHGAQPSDRVIFILKSQGVKLPSWVSLDDKKKDAIRNQAKLRRNRPPGEPAPEPKVVAEEEAVAEAPAEVPASSEEVVATAAEAEASPESEAVSEVTETTTEETPAAAETETAETETAEPEAVGEVPEASPAAEEPLEK
jgi:small subunit ribosomal protein S16